MFGSMQIKNLLNLKKRKKYKKYPAKLINQIK